MEAAKLVMNAEASSLMLLDEATGNLNVSIPTGPVKDEITGMVIPKNKGIGGWVITYNQPFITNDVVESDIFWKDLSNSFTTRNIICVPLKDDEGKPFGVLQALNKADGKNFESNDVPVFESLALHVASAILRSKKFDKLERHLKEKEMQLSEIHHRLKNNLSMICGLMEFDLEDIADVSAKQVLATTSSRIRSVAKAHALLYEQNSMTDMDLSDYLDSVAMNVERVFDDPTKDISLRVHLDELKLDANRSMLCGLILNELLINAYKHAFINRTSGEVIVRLKRTPNEKVVLIVTDNGIGFESIEEENTSQPNGTFIVKSLSDKLNADVTYTKNPEIGSTCIISFKY